MNTMVDILHTTCLNAFASNFTEFPSWDLMVEKLSLVPPVAWRQTGNPPLPESMLMQIEDAKWLHWATIIYDMEYVI